MRSHVHFSLVFLLMSACTCLQTVVEFADAGADAGPDAGPFDTRDAAVMIDAGSASDGGSSLDAGSIDAGPPLPEVCDGIDNDFDGLVDREPDGGFLTQPCPLASGVCFGRAALCVDGGFRQCDYGPDFELVEQRCDGLDNDCDGRIDKSRRSIVSSDAGEPAAFRQPAVLFMDGGIVVSTYNALRFLNHDLSEDKVVSFPSAYYVDSVIADGDHFEVAGQTRPSGPSAVFSIGPRGEMQILADGGIEGAILGTKLSASPSYVQKRFARLGSTLIFFHGTTYGSGWDIEFEVAAVEDAGLTRLRSFHLTDGGTSLAGTFTGTVFDGGVLLTFRTSPAIVPRNELWHCDASAQNCSFIRELPGFYQTFHGPAPIILTRPYDPLNGQTHFFETVDGQVLNVSKSPGVPGATRDWVVSPTEGEQLIAARPAIWPETSTEYWPSGAEIGFLMSDGGIEKVDDLENIATGGINSLAGAQVTGRLYVIVWYESLDVPVPPEIWAKHQRYHAEYVCAP